jgi:hypothetical protein
MLVFALVNVTFARIAGCWLLAEGEKTKYGCRATQRAGFICADSIYFAAFVIKRSSSGYTSNDDKRGNHRGRGAGRGLALCTASPRRAELR